MDRAGTFAVVGRVSSGKSTLVNALVEARIAPVKAGECTKMLTLYRYGVTQTVTVHRRDGQRAVIGVDGALPDDLGVPASDVELLEVSLSNGRLEHSSFLDTPGLDSFIAQRSAATLERLSSLEESDVDVIVYLLTHLREVDDSLLAELEKQPVPIVLALSRVDELTAPGVDPWDAANGLASRIADRFGSSVSAVVPVVGLWAETATTGGIDRTVLDTVNAVRRLPSDRRDEALSSTVDLIAAVNDPVAAKTSLKRLGLAGLRTCVSSELIDEPDLADALLASSNIELLRHQIITARASGAEGQAAVRTDDLTPRSPDVLTPAAMLLGYHQRGEVTLPPDRLAEVGDLLRGGLDRPNPVDAVRLARAWRSYGNRMLVSVEVRNAIEAVRRQFEARAIQVGHDDR